MAAIPLLEEVSTGPAGSMLSSLASMGGPEVSPRESEALPRASVTRSLAIYPASAGFELVEELEHLCARSVEPNVFFNPRFLAPAMPRLEDKEIRLAVIRDVEEHRSRLRLLVPFSVERPPVPFGVPIMRTWSNPFGPLGTPLVDHDDPEGVIADFFSLLARPRLKLPRVFAFPETRLDGPFAAILAQFAASRNLTLVTTGTAERPFLQSNLDGDEYLRQSLSAHHVRGYGRMKRRLGDLGTVEHVIARNPTEIRQGIEAFLSLEASGWKGREGTAMAIDRYRAAFAREAVHRLAERDLCRVHMLTLDGHPIACVIVLVESGIAYTWKTAFDETYARWSPGTLLMLEVTRSHLDDPNILGTDSCAVPDHPVMSRIWSERRTVGTLVVGLTPDADRLARQAASQLHLYRETRNFARIVRERLRRMLGRA
jgi:CelD/BcsL family acetyltransferase involved in cellulose biosynthesis